MEEGRDAQTPAVWDRGQRRGSKWRGGGTQRPGYCLSPSEEEPQETTERDVARPNVTRTEASLESRISVQAEVGGWK